MILQGEKIIFHCRKCKKSMKISYIVTLKKENAILPDIEVKCHYCGRIMICKKYTEERLLKEVQQGRCYV